MAKKKQPAGLVCVGCKRETSLGEAVRAVQISRGMLHDKCHTAQQANVKRIIADAIKAGTHTADPREAAKRICGRCGLARIIYHTFQRHDFCFPCAMILGEFENLTDRQLADCSRSNPIPAEDPQFSARCRAAIKAKDRKRARHRAALQAVNIGDHR